MRIGFIGFGEAGSHIATRLREAGVSIEHGERRAREMEEVAETLRASGIEPIMTEAIARRQEWCAHLGVNESQAVNPKVCYAAVLRAIDDVKCFSEKVL